MPIENVFLASLCLSLFLSSLYFFRLWRKQLTALQAARIEVTTLQTECRQTEADKLEAKQDLENLRLTSQNLIAENSKVTTQLEQLQQNRKQELQFIEDSKQALQDSFKSLAAKALEGNTQQFFDLAKEKLGHHEQMASSELEKRELAIKNLVQPLNEVLDKYHHHIDGIEKERQRSYLNIESELKKVMDSTSNLSRETLALKTALKKPHVRGRWGEVQLRNCIELAGMSEYADVSFQDVNADEDGRLHIPDMTVRMPGGRSIVVDAKTPIDAFLNSLEAQTDEERGAEMSRHSRHVKEHVKKLSSRAYFKSLKESPDFTLMFLPNESFLYAALESEPDLMEYALQKKVLIATPPTLVGLLKVIRFGWNEERLAENAQKISEAGKELHKRLSEFLEGYLSVGKHLDRAKKEYSAGLGRIERRLISKARDLEALGAKSHKKLAEVDLGGELAPPSSEAPDPELNN